MYIFERFCCQYFLINCLGYRYVNNKIQMFKKSKLKSVLPLSITCFNSALQVAERRQNLPSFPQVFPSKHISRLSLNWQKKTQGGIRPSPLALFDSRYCLANIIRPLHSITGAPEVKLFPAVKIFTPLPFKETLQRVTPPIALERRSPPRPFKRPLDNL